MIRSIENLPLITGALEATDREIRGASKLRWNLQAAMIWAANAVITARDRQDIDAEVIAKNRLSSIDVMLRTIRQDGFDISFDEAVLRRHLGIEERLSGPTDHEEAIRMARSRVMVTRQSAKFTEFYNAAKQQLVARRAERISRVADIDALVSNVSNTYYDEDSIEREIESLEGKIAEASEMLYWHADQKANVTFLPAAYHKFIGFKTAAMSMLTTLGITEDNLIKRQDTLRAQLKRETDAMNQADEALSGDVDKQLAALNATEAPTPAARFKRVPAPVA